MPRRTERGFRIYTESKDTNGCVIRVQESSLANERCVWIFAHDPDPKCNEDDCPTPHLNVKQAKRVIAALQKFVDGK